MQVSAGEPFCLHSNEFNTELTMVCNKCFMLFLVCSSAVDQFLNGTAPNTTGLCNFTVLQFACLPAVMLHRRRTLCSFSLCLIIFSSCVFTVSVLIKALLCHQLSQLNSQQVADLLACKLSSNVTKDTWKLFFTKTSTNLDVALLKFSNKV